MTQAKIGVGIIGGTGYGAHELLRLLAQRPEVAVVSVVSRSQSNQPLAATYPDLTTVYDQSFVEELDYAALQSYQKQIVFTALPHGVSIATINTLLSKCDNDSLHVIDLSGDLRLQAESQHALYYPDTDYAAALRQKFTYGLTELNHAAIKVAKHIANPGCYPTASTLALAPLVKNRLFTGTLIINAASGTSGAGKNPSEKFHHPLRNSSVCGYAALSHRHEPEIQQALGALTDATIETVFVPHLLPVSRGIHITAYAQLLEPCSKEKLLELYQDFYAQAAFVRIRTTPPELADVVGSNYCDIHITVRDKQVVVFAVEDNLIKGMAGQAIQNMNLIAGLDETCGLLQAPLGLL